MASSNRSVRGDVNVILNKLVREGIIVGFSTNFDTRSTAEPEVTVIAGTAMDHGRVQDAVCRALEPVPETIIVTVKAG